MTFMLKTTSLTQIFCIFAFKEHLVLFFMYAFHHTYIYILCLTLIEWLLLPSMLLLIAGPILGKR